MLTHTFSYAEAYPIGDLDFEEIELLPLEHAGARDPEYRLRRNFIADMARQYRHDPQRGVPLVEYTEEEHTVWQHVSEMYRLPDRRTHVEIDLTADVSSAHLDFAEELAPYVDGLIDGTDLEVIETHLRQCAFWAREVSDLRAFAERLKDKPLGDHLSHLLRTVILRCRVDADSRLLLRYPYDDFSIQHRYCNGKATGR